MLSSHLPNFERKTYFHGIHLSLNQTSKVSASSTKRTSEDRIAAKQEHSRKRLVSGVAIISRFSLVSASDRLWKARVRKTEEPLTKGKKLQEWTFRSIAESFVKFYKKCTRRAASCDVKTLFSQLSAGFRPLFNPYLFVRSSLISRS